MTWLSRMWAVRQSQRLSIARACGLAAVRDGGAPRYIRFSIMKRIAALWCGAVGRDTRHSISEEPPVRVESDWPGIVDRESFDLVQRRLAAKSPVVTHPRTVPSFYLLSGLLFCSCGRAMTGHSAKSGRHFYYLCSRSSKQGRDVCDARMLPKDKLD